MEFADHWTLDPQVSFLNHGSFGACLRTVQEAQSTWRSKLENQPVHFFVRELESALDKARFALSEFVGAHPEQVAFVSNTTTGINSVLRSLHFAPGDELLVCNHEYNASRNILEFVAERDGAKVVLANVPFPIEDPSQATAAFEAAMGPKTRLILVDHITSATGLIFPLEAIAAAAHQRGIDVLVDGAHAPGMIPLELEALGVAWYTGNLHKWLCTPKGSAFLYARKDKRDAVRPAVISHGANIPTTERSRFRHEFDWTGTMDPTPWLVVPDAIKAMAALVEGGWPAIMASNRTKVLAARTVLCEALGVAPPAPESMIGALAAIPMPDGEAAPPAALYVDPLQARLWDEHKIEVPISPWPKAPKRILRVSAQLYNQPEEYERLANTLQEMLGA